MDWTRQMETLMQERGWTQSELAKRLGIGAVQVSRLLGGHTKAPSRATLEALERLTAGEDPAPDADLPERTRLAEMDAAWCRDIIRHETGIVRRPWGVRVRHEYGTDEVRVHATSRDYAMRVAEVLEPQSRATEAAPALLRSDEVSRLVELLRWHLKSQESTTDVVALRDALAVWTTRLEEDAAIDSQATLTGRVQRARLRTSDGGARWYTAQPHELGLERKPFRKASDPTRTVWLIRDEHGQSYDAITYETQDTAEQALARYVREQPDGSILWTDEE